MTRKKRALLVLALLLFAAIGTYIITISNAAINNYDVGNTFTIPDATGRLNQYNTSTSLRYPTDRVPDIEIVNGTFDVNAQVPSYLHDGTRPNPGHAYIHLGFQGLLESYECKLQCQATSGTYYHPQHPTEGLGVLKMCIELPASSFGTLQDIVQVYIKPNSQEDMNRSNGKDGTPANSEANIVADILWFNNACPTWWQGYADYRTGGLQYEESMQHVVSDISGVRTVEQDPNTQGNDPGLGAGPSDGNGPTGESNNPGNGTGGGAGGGGGGSIAIKPSDQPNSIPESSQQGDQKAEQKLEPSPFFDGKEFDRGSDATNLATIRVANSKFSFGWLHIIGIMLLGIGGGIVYWRWRQK